MRVVRSGPNPIIHRGIILALILLATWLRFWRLVSIPPGLWFDEAYNGMDAVWMTKLNTWPLFLAGNNGREAIFHYLLALSIYVFGTTAYAIRLVSALLGILSIPMMYRWTRTIFSSEASADWLGLLGTAGLVASFWYLVMNRAGYRANLFPLFILVTSYFFWRGWQTGKLRCYFLAGVGLGLCQYSYSSARLVPLVFILFIAIQILRRWFTEPAQLKINWPGLFIMGGTSLLLVVPLFLYSLTYPNAFWGRIRDVAITVDESGAGLKTLGFHLEDAVRVFIDGEDPNIRHHLPGRPGFDGVNMVGFWVGLLIVIRYIRRPHHIFLLLLLLVLWLPAVLSEPAFHTLRLSGILPAYYAIMALGLLSLTIRLSRMFPLQITAWQGGLAALLILLTFSGGITVYDYFYRWANLPDVYQEYDGPVVELTNYLISPESGSNLIIPFYLYAHASARYGLHGYFKEAVLLPAQASSILSRQEKVKVVIPTYPPDDYLPPVLVWLVKERDQPGTAYISIVKRDLNLPALVPQSYDLIEGSFNNIIARQYLVDLQDILPLFPQRLPRKTADVIWADNLRLIGYEFMPQVAEAGGASRLYLAWEILADTDLPAKMFLQLLDSQGNPIGQQEIEPLSRKMYRWRQEGLALEQHPLNFQAGLQPDLYFVRLGFFDPNDEHRLEAYTSDGQPLGDEIIVGPLYIRQNNVDPTVPARPVQATLGNAFEVLGYSISAARDEASTTEIKLYWKAHAAVNRDYTVFVQLLDQQNNIIAQHDAQPLQGIYPTSRWQPGDIIVDRFTLSVSPGEVSNGHGRLVTGMYDLLTGVRLPAYTKRGELLLDGLVDLRSEAQ